MTYYLTSALAYTIEMISVTLMLLNSCTSKRKLSRTILFGSLLFSAAFGIFVLFDNLYVNFAVSFLIVFIYSHFFFDCSLMAAVIFAVILDASMVGTEFFSMNVLTLVFGTSLYNYKSSSLMYFLLAVTSKILYFIVCQIVSHIDSYIKGKSGRFGKNEVPVNISKSKTPLFFLIYPICVMLACTLFWIMSSNYTFSPQLNMAIMIVCVLFLAAIVATYFLYDQTAKKEAELYRLNSELEKMRIDEEYYKVLDYQNEELKMFVHDEKNHLSVIKSLSGNPEVDKYIEKIYGDLKKYSAVGTSKNKMLDLIINKYRVLCETENVDFNVNIKTSNLSFINDADLTALMSNILDNALEAAKHSRKRTIDLSINFSNGHDVLTCVNSCDKKPISDSRVLKTTKQDKKYHGLGTKSIKNISNKYDGDCVWEYDERKNEFAMYIMFGID